MNANFEIESTLNLEVLMRNFCRESQFYIEGATKINLRTSMKSSLIFKIVMNNIII